MSLVPNGLSLEDNCPDQHQNKVNHQKILNGDAELNGSQALQFFTEGTKQVQQGNMKGHNSFGDVVSNGKHEDQNSTDFSSSRKEEDLINFEDTPPWYRNLVLETEELTADALADLFNDKICVLCVKNYIPDFVCEKLDTFLREKGSDPYTHEIRKNGKVDLQYFGVNRYGYPLNSIYTDETGENLEKYLKEALPTMRSIRKAAAPYLSPIDKFRVELDEAWPKKANVATFKGQKTLCGIGRIMPTSLSKLSEVHPHFDAVPVSCFPDIHKQFTANFYLNVPDQGGELEIWNVPPLDISTIEEFKIPEDWRSQLPASIKVKPEKGDLLLFNTRRPHAITSFSGLNPRTSLQTFIGYTKESEIFLWV